MSKIIVIEGPDRVGKHTQCNILAQRFKEAGKKATVVEVPIRGHVTYRLIYWMLRNGSAKSLPKTFQVLQFLNRKFFQWFQLPFLKRKNDYLIFDRWSLSTCVYGAAEGVPDGLTVSLKKMLLEPNYTIVLTGPGYMKTPDDVYEADTALQKRVNDLYLHWAVRDPNASMISCVGDKESVANKIVAELLKSGVVPINELSLPRRWTM
jgi:thymidylate kinase